ncbi:TonB-dependent receptor [Sphingobium sp. Leaf26]|uniref:TonB-dependent receptor n=1 Tax=Sphingobium sp. Leaf26 TaxID=1735693 RepID=UPI0006FB2685|nr:TonB-dependent receptor [Sphingobium sp. Leaf26]KQN08602.1 TonB-dependent receptor [Sphingobium sp. Leaf26]
MNIEDSFSRIVACASTSAIALLAVLGTSPLQAQEADPSSDQPQTQDIIVTAQFRNQKLQDTPIAITAVTAETLEARAQASVNDIATFTPNVNIAPAFASFGSSINAFIRGIGQNDSNFALEPGVGIYIDDVYYGATFGAVFDLSDLERIEVLRGPQGTLSGKNSLGGSVKLFSKKPDGTGGGYIEGTYGRFNRIDLRGGINLTLADGLYLRASGVSKHRNGFLKRLDYGCANPAGGIVANPAAGDGCKIGTEGGQDLNAGRLALRYAPDGSPLEINLIVDATEDKSEPAASKLIFAGNPGVRSYDPANPAGGVPFDSRFITGAHSYSSYASYAAGGNFTTVFGTPYVQTPGFQARPESSVSARGVSGSIDYELTDALKLKSITAYRSVKGYSGVDLDASPLNLGTQGNHFEHKQFTQELRLSGQVGDLVDYTVGGFYYDADGLIRQRVNLPTVLMDFLTDDPVKTSSKSGFAHVEVHASDDLNFIGGLRYTKDKKTYTFSRRNADGSAISGIPLTENFVVASLDGIADTFTDDRWDFRLGVNYRWSDALMTYAQVSTGYKGGGVNPRPYHPGQLRTFGPETLTTYEAGFKADFLNRAARVNGAIFFNKYKDIQITLLACPEVPCSLPANAGDADVLGFELEGTLQPVAGLTLDGSVGYLDFDYKRVDPSTFVTLDQTAPFVSKWQASAGIAYALDLGSAGTLTPRADWSYRSSFYFTAPNNPGNKVDARNLVNMRLTYQTVDEDWSVALGVTNLFDKFYYVGKNENVAGFGVNQGILAPPREWSMTIKRKF